MVIFNLDVNIGLDGLCIKVGLLSDWVKGGVCLILDKLMGEVKSEYLFYKDIDYVEFGVVFSEKWVILMFFVKEFFGIS